MLIIIIKKLVELVSDKVCGLQAFYLPDHK